MWIEGFYLPAFAAVIMVIAVILFTLMFTRIKLAAWYDGAFGVKISYLFFTIRVNRGRKGEAKKKKKAKPEKKRKLKFKDVKSILRIFSRSWPEIKKSTGLVISGIVADTLELNITVGGDDAAAVAMHYGEICGMVSALLASVQNVIKIKSKRIMINADFDGGDSDFRFRTCCGIRVYRLVAAGMTAAAGIITALIKNLRENGGTKTGKGALQMADERPIEGIMDTTLQHIRQMVDVNTIVGDKISLPDGTVVIPVSKVSMGFASGGSDFGQKTQKNMFGGGGGDGMSIIPVAFLCVSEGKVKLLQIEQNTSSTGKAIELVPELFDKIVALFKKDKDKSGPRDDEEETGKQRPAPEG